MEVWGIATTALLAYGMWRLTSDKAWTASKYNTALRVPICRKKKSADG